MDLSPEPRSGRGSHCPARGRRALVLFQVIPTLNTVILGPQHGLIYLVLCPGEVIFPSGVSGQV